MVKLRKGPVCQGTLSDGVPCGARVGRAGDRCHVCLERQALSTDVAVRRELATAASLPAPIFEVLGADADDGVRLAIASREDCPLVVLQELEHDEHPEVRAAAASRLSSAFAPRVLHESSPGAGGLFTRAELDALGQEEVGSAEDPFDPPALAAPAALAAATSLPADAPVAPSPAPVRRARRSGATHDDGLFTGIDEILNRLDALSTRLTSLESVLASAGERLGAISDRLDGLGPAELASEQPAVAEAPTSGGSLVPVGYPAELGTGPVIRADIVAAAWLAVLPLLARARDRGSRGPSVAVVNEPVAGPFAGAADGAVAELLPAPTAREGEAVLDGPVIEAVASLHTDWREARPAQRRQHARRRGLRRR
jgi:hypothetical protein